MTDQPTTPATPANDAPATAPAPQSRQPAPLGQLAAALAKAQGQFTNPVRNRQVTVRGQAKSGKDFEYTFRYADLAACLDVVRKPLSDNGLAIVQLTVQKQDTVWVRTMLVHSSGEALSQELEAGNVKQDVKQLGGQITYMRRYCLSAMLGLASEEDEDENPAGGAAREEPRGDRKRRQREERPPEEERSPAQADAGKNGNGQAQQPARKYPWDLDPNWRPAYQSDAHVWVTIKDGNLVQAEVGKLSTDDLTALEERIGARQKAFADPAKAHLREACGRDLRLVSGELLARAGDTQGVEDNGAKAPAASAPVSAQKGDTPAAGDGPLPPAVAVQPVTIAEPVPTDITRPTTALDTAEAGQLEYMTGPEVLAMALAPENRELFDASLGKALGQFNEKNLELFSGAWLAGCWLRCLEADKKLRLKARKLARTAIFCLDLKVRAETLKPDFRPVRTATAAEFAQASALALAMAGPDQAAKAMRLIGLRAEGDLNAADDFAGAMKAAAKA